MVLPLATTTITVTRTVNDGTVDRYDTPDAPITVATAVRAVINAPTGSTSLTRGERTVTAAAFRADPCDIREGDTLTDDTTGAAYQVLWAHSRYELGLAYTYGECQTVTGAP